MRFYYAFTEKNNVLCRDLCGSRLQQVHTILAQSILNDQIYRFHEQKWRRKKSQFENSIMYFSVNRIILFARSFTMYSIRYSFVHEKRYLLRVPISPSFFPFFLVSTMRITFDFQLFFRFVNLHFVLNMIHMYILYIVLLLFLKQFSLSINGLLENLLQTEEKIRSGQDLISD